MVTEKQTMSDSSGHVFARRLDRPLPVAIRAEGVWIEDASGKRYLDASGGAIVVNVGHGRREIADAVAGQIAACYYAHPTMFTTPAVEQLADVLSGHAPEGISRFYFVSSGSEAVETAIKLARQVHLEADRAQRFRLISRWKSYHGLTMGALSAMGRTVFRTPYTPMLTDVTHIPAPYCLRCSYGLTYPQCGVRCALALEETIENLGAETVSAFLAETVSGGTLAAYAPPPEYLTIVADICRRYGVLLILDEVLCGMGRTGRWFACQHYGVSPDIVTLGKGIAGGAMALSAVGVQEKHFEAIRSGSGNFVHGGTFSHHPVAAAAGLAAVGILEREHLVARVSEFGPVLGERLRTALSGHPHVADVRGIGFLWGVELVADKASLKPSPRKEKVAERLYEAVFNRGVIVYKSTGLAGTDGDAFLVAPPFIITDEQVDLAVAAIREGLNEVLG
jgi:adenosylmethionine-8-amino-7-oxononanoate aminotransferase